jgi:hypothetical protein
VLLMIFVTFSGVEDFHWLLLFVLTFAISVSSILTLVGLLNYPFQGALALTPDDFVERLDNVMALLRAL